MRIFLFLIILSVGCNNQKQSRKRLNQDLKLETIKSILLDTSNNLINEKLILADKGKLTPPSIGDFTHELDYVMHVLNESDSAFIKQQFRERKDFSTSKLNSQQIRVLPITQLGQDSIQFLLDTEHIEGFYSVEMPVFNKSLTMVYLRLGYMCGPLCGNQFDLVLTKKLESENWTIAEELGFSIY